MTTNDHGAPAAAGAPASDRALSAGGRSDAMSALLADNWWAVALRGVAAILFGLITFLFPGATILSFVLVFSAYMLIDGVLAVVSAVRAARRHERWVLLLLEGVTNIAAGALAFVWPGITVLVFVLLLAAWSLVSGVLMLGSAFRLHKTHGRWWMALSGAVSILFAVALVVAPLIGAVVLTWWLGAYAFAFGVALLVLAFRLRGRRGERIGTGPAAGAAGRA